MTAQDSITTPFRNTLKEQFPNLLNKVDESKTTEVIKIFISKHEDEQ
jgi:hypothetical protein